MQLLRLSALKEIKPKRERERDQVESPQMWVEPQVYLQCVNGRGRSGEQTAGGYPKASPRPRQPPFAGAALRELESACRLSI